MKIALLGLGLLHMSGAMAGMLMAEIPEAGNGGGAVQPWVAGDQLVTETQPAPGEIGISPSAVPIVVADPAVYRVPRTDEIVNPVPERSERVAEAPRLHAVEGRALWVETPLSVILQEQKDLKAQQTSPLATLEVTPATSTGAVGTTVQLAVAVTPAGASKSVTYVSSDPTKATVSATGLVTRVATGTSTITVTSAVDSTKTDTVAITVS